MAKKTIGWGLIGSTSWSDHTFGPAITAAKGATLAAVFSSKRSHAEAFRKKHGVPNGYTDLDAFLADPAIDAVWVAGPTDLHKEQTIAALKAGKHVLCEKPMAVSAADCAAMVRAGVKSKRVLGLGYNNRHSPVYQAVQRDWAKGVYGAPVHIRTHVCYPAANTQIGWRGFPKRSGGWALGNIGTHLIDVARWFMGDVAEASGHLTNHAWGLKVDDFALVNLTFKNGASGIVTAGMGRVGGGPGRLELYGTKGWCIFDGTLFGSAGTMTASVSNATPQVKQIAAVNTYRNQVEAFGRAVRGEAPFQATARDGLANLKIMERARGW
jgi:1,5-anhydro-D-fructose reductase (1,5-anhydro-D-mannitol-forming)